MLGPFCFCPGPGTRVGKEEELFVLYVVRWLALLIEAPMKAVEANVRERIAESEERISKAKMVRATAAQNDLHTMKLEFEVKRERRELKKRR